VIAAVDIAGNESENSAEVSGAPTADTEAPTTPTNLLASAASSTQIDLSWDASTDNVEVAGYKVERSTDGATFEQIATALTNSFTDTTVLSGTTYYYRVKAFDGAQNESNYSNTAEASTPAVTRYEEDHASVSYTGSWGAYNGASHSGGSIKASKATGDYAVFTFTGTKVTWIGNKNFNRGIAKVYIDGVYQQDVDCYSDPGQFQVELFTKTGLTNAEHTIKIEVKGTKNASSSDLWVPIDAFDVSSN